VYAIDLLGFGLSDKPVQDYSAEVLHYFSLYFNLIDILNSLANQVWKDQVLDFIKEVIKRPCAVAGNSLGGFTALYASSASESSAKKLITSCILLNAAGRFRSPDQVVAKESPQWQKALSAALQRFVIGLSFIYTKQPARVEQILRQVYPVNADNVDKELVESILFPAQDKNAAEVFYRVIKKNGNGPAVYMDDLLESLSMPLLLLWGEKDPWIRPQAADRIQSLYPRAVRVSVDAGHCPHDEAPDAVNKAIMNFY
jgi:pimeloyl-ACP methyl ester carboxylesterase